MVFPVHVCFLPRNRVPDLIARVNNNADNQPMLRAPTHPIHILLHAVHVKYYGIHHGALGTQLLCFKGYRFLCLVGLPLHD